MISFAVCTILVGGPSRVIPCGWHFRIGSSVFVFLSSSWMRSQNSGLYIGRFASQRPLNRTSPLKVSSRTNSWSYDWFVCSSHLRWPGPHRLDAVAELIVPVSSKLRAPRSPAAPPQMPLRSGLPSGIRGVAFCAEAPNTSATLNASAIAMVFIAPSSIAVGIAEPRDNHVPIRHRQLLHEAHRVPISRRESGRGYDVADLEAAFGRLLEQPEIAQRADGARLELPDRLAAILVGDFDVQH